MITSFPFSAVQHRPGADHPIGLRGLCQRLPEAVGFDPNQCYVGDEPYYRAVPFRAALHRQGRSER